LPVCGGEHSRVIDEYLTAEIKAGQVFGPMTNQPSLYLQISRFGVIPKKNKSNAWHLILDLSHRLGHSVNDGINKDEFPVSYSKVDNANALILKRGKGALMGKVDIKNAYRIVPIHPDDYYLLGMQWRDIISLISLFRLDFARRHIFLTVWLTYSNGYSQTII
jgi:hypothetical protein